MPGHSSEELGTGGGGGFGFGVGGAGVSTAFGASESDVRGGGGLLHPRLSSVLWCSPVLLRLPRPKPSYLKRIGIET